MMEEPVDEREDLVERITARLAELDEETLRELDARTEEALTGVPRIASPVVLTPLPQPISRRELLVGLVAGGAAVAGSSVAAGVWGANRGVALGRAAAQAEGLLEITRLRDLLTLYENLEKVDLDAIVAAAMSAMGLALKGLRAGISLLRDGVQLVDEALARFEELVPLLRSGLSIVEGLVRAIAERLEALGDLVSDILGRAAPLAEGLGGLFSSLLDLIPLGIGERIRQVLASIQELFGRLPGMIEAFQTWLFGPLRADWFSEEEGAGIESSLFDPIRRQLLEPLGSFLEEVAGVLERWESEMVQPVETALSQRNAIRQEISQYRRDQGLA